MTSYYCVNSSGSWKVFEKSKIIPKELVLDGVSALGDGATPNEAILDSGVKPYLVKVIECQE